MNSRLMVEGKEELVSFSSLPLPMDPDHTQHVPWLLVSHGDNLERHTLCNLSKNEVHLQTSISEFRNKLVVQTSYGWLALFDLATSPTECCLMNIASKQKIQLPKIEPNSYRFFNCILSKPPSDSDCHILLLPSFINGFSDCRLGDDKYIKFCRLGDDKYIKTEYPGGEDSIVAATNHNGKVIVWMSRLRRFFEIDFVAGQAEPIFRQLVNHMGQPCRILRRLSPAASFVSTDVFVETCDDLLLVRLICKHSSFEASYFRIFKVHDCSELTTIGDRTIFLSRNGKSICCSSSGAIKKNSIYYYWEGRYLIVYDIEDRSITPIKPCSYEKGASFLSWVMM